MKKFVHNSTNKTITTVYTFGFYLKRVMIIQGLWSKKRIQTKLVRFVIPNNQ
jgi:hypothetical protein